MNYYFLLEDEESFFNVLPMWLDYMDFGCKRVLNYHKLTTNSYVIGSGHGVSRLENDVLYSTINTIQSQKRIVDKLVIIIDAEDLGVAERKKRIYDSIFDKYSSEFESIPCSIHVFVCNRCFESWLLGCMGLYPSNIDFVSNDFKSYYDFYDIEHNNPEKMLKPLSFDKTVASYHFQYLHTLTLDIQKQNKLKKFTYRKSSPNCALRKDYFEAMVQRINTTEDISTFKEFYDFIIAERENNK